jgi:hypothetical protein
MSEIKVSDAKIFIADDAGNQTEISADVKDFSIDHGDRKTGEWATTSSFLPMSAHAAISIFIPVKFGGIMYKGFFGIVQNRNGIFRLHNGIMIEAFTAKGHYEFDENWPYQYFPMSKQHVQAALRKIPGTVRL